MLCFEFLTFGLRKTLLPGFLLFFSGKFLKIIRQLVTNFAHISLHAEDKVAVMIQSQGEGVTESGLRAQTRVTVLLSALGDHMTQSLQQMRAGRGGLKKGIFTSAKGA